MEDNKVVQLTAARNKQGRTILLADGELLRILDEIQDAILDDASGGVLFQRGGVLAHLQRATIPETQSGIRRASGALTITVSVREWLRLRMARAAKFARYDARSKTEVPKDPPLELASALGSAVGMWRFPTLLAVVEAPTMRPDGTILDRPGYDIETGLFFDPGSVTFPEIPPSPTKEDARRALHQLHDVIREFTFVDKAAKAVALAGMLTMLVRRSLRTAPLFIVDAPVMASGKTLLAEIIGITATDRTLPAMSYTGDENEERKRITAALACGDPAILIDNISHPLKGDALCAVLTQEIWKDRILGASQIITLPTCTTWFATGNNITVAGDMSTRVLICRIDPECERPEEREFERPDLRGYVRAQRGELVKASLTILRAYVSAGRPKQNIKPFGRFEEWSDLVRSALVWLGVTDPCLSRDNLVLDDPVRSGLGQVLTAWRDSSAPEHAGFGMAEAPEDQAIDYSVDVLGEPEAQRSGFQLSFRQHGLEGIFKGEVSFGLGWG
jgi:hypothetical protein